MEEYGAELHIFITGLSAIDSQRGTLFFVTPTHVPVHSVVP